MASHKPGKGRIKSVVLCVMRRLTMLLAAYLLGYFGWSVAWLLLVVTIIVVVKDYSVQQKLRVQTAKDKELINLKEKISNEFPTDSLLETAEWLNKVIARLWPHVLQHVTTTVKQEMESSIQATLKKYKLGGNFHFKKALVGSRPVHVSCLEVLQESPLNEIIICADITYESDCDVRFMWRGVKGGMTNFQVRGRAHLVLRPLMDAIPFIAGYHIIFPEKPTIEYKLSGVGIFLDIPGLREIVRHIITKRISNFMFGGKASDADSIPGYQMLVETSGQENNEPNTPVLHSSIFDQLSEIEGTIHDQSSVSGETAHDHSSFSDETGIDDISHNQSTLSNLKCNHMSEEETCECTTSVEKTYHWSTFDGATNDQISVTGETSAQTSVPGVMVREHSSMSGETSYNRSSVSSEFTYYNPIPKPSRRLTVSVSEEEAR